MASLFHICKVAAAAALYLVAMPSPAASELAAPTRSPICAAASVVHAAGKAPRSCRDK
jgi:hypothetical protein